MCLCDYSWKASVLCKLPDRVDLDPKFECYFGCPQEKKMAQLKSLQRRLTSTVVLGAEVREREMREARLEEEKMKQAVVRQRAGVPVSEEEEEE